VDANARIDEILAQVRAGGGRATTARRAILQTLIDHHDHHPTAEHITSAVQQDQPEIAESTVYRFLDELERLGIVDHVRLGHGPAVYHFAEDTKHHHLVCDDCGKVTEVPQQIFDALRETMQRDFAFVMEPRHFTMPGRCSRCEPPPAPPGSPTHLHSHSADGHHHPHVHN